MQQPQNIDINDFIYDLPDERIPKYPLAQRDQSKLLFYTDNQMDQKLFCDLPELMPKNSVLYFNNTRVIHARLFFRKSTGALIEVFCLEPSEPSEHQLALQCTGRVVWNCIVGNLKKWKQGSLVQNIKIGDEDIALKARVKTRMEGSVDIEFTWNGDVSFADILEEAGNIPIPPYLHRASEENDKNTYQTIYAQVAGSVAAPTAGLHFTPRVFDAMRARGIEWQEVTLHVGAGTFQQVKSDRVGDHKMHKETLFVSRKQLKALAENEKRIMAVGTTTVRTLETLYWLGVKALKGESVHLMDQWYAYQNDDDILPSVAFNALLDLLEESGDEYLMAATEIIIAPGYMFKVVEGIITNFHQPRSTLLLLISAFVGEAWRNIYDYALSHDFRFLSYGDSSFLLK